MAPHLNLLQTVVCRGEYKGGGMKEAEIFKGTIVRPQIDQIYAHNEEQCTNQTDWLSVFVRGEGELQSPNSKSANAHVFFP